MVVCSPPQPMWDITVSEGTIGGYLQQQRGADTRHGILVQVLNLAEFQYNRESTSLSFLSCTSIF